MVRPLVGTLSLGASLVFWSQAPADITAFWVPVASGDGSVGSMYPPAAVTAPGGDPALLGMQTWILKVATDGEWDSAGLRAVLPSGTFYNHPLGSMVTPSFVFIAMYPALRFDT